MFSYRVIADHRSVYPNPLELRAGQRVAFERRETEWAGWIWCVDENGVEGWVPESWTTLDGDTATLQKDYSARELTASVGETVHGIAEESGWVWAVTGERSGWIPRDNLEP